MRRATRIPFVVWYSLSVLLFIEVSLQGFYYVAAGQTLWTRVGRPLYVPNQFAGYFNRPYLDLDHNTSEFRSHIYTNSAGFRVPRTGVEYAVEKPPGTSRFILLGPSFAFGWGVQDEDSLAARLTELLGVQVINAGVPALGAYPALQWYAHVGRQYRADVVLQVVYGSMTVDRSRSAVTVDEAGYLVPDDPSGRQRLVAVAKKSALMFYAWTLYTRAFPTPAATTGRAERRLSIGSPFSTDDPEVTEALKYYDELRRTVRDAGATPVIVHAPSSYTIHRGDVARWRSVGVLGVDEGLVQFDRDFCEYLTSHALLCVNVTPALIEAAATSGERLYYWLDTHWTKRGNAVAARAVADALAHLGFTSH